MMTGTAASYTGVSLSRGRELTWKGRKSEHMVEERLPPCRKRGHFRILLQKEKEDLNELCKTFWFFTFQVATAIVSTTKDKSANVGGNNDEKKEM